MTNDNDIVERLLMKFSGGLTVNPDGIEAADEITRLRAQNAELVEALREIRDAGPTTVDDNRWRIARAAIAAVLEEAAKAVRRMPSPSSEWMADELLRALGPANPVPAAIRAMMKEDQ